MLLQINNTIYHCFRVIGLIASNPVFTVKKHKTEGIILYESITNCYFLLNESNPLFLYKVKAKTDAKLFLKQKHIER